MDIMQYVQGCGLVSDGRDLNTLANKHPLAFLAPISALLLR